MKHLFLYAGIGAVVYALYKQRSATAGTGTDGMVHPTSMGTSPAQLVVPGATAQAGAAMGCNTCDQISGLGGDSRITVNPQIDSPSAVSHAVERLDFEHINPFTNRANAL